MSDARFLVLPSLLPPLDPDFRPAALANHHLRAAVVDSGGGEPLLLALEGADGSIARRETIVFACDHPRASDNLLYSERLLKFMLWQHGGWRVYVAGPDPVVRHLAACYAPGGPRAFDCQFMSLVYRQGFTLLHCAPSEAPAGQQKSRPLGRHTDGCRIGFDLGASDLKVSAVIDGQVVFSQEIEWNPRPESDPAYHRLHIMNALRSAAAHLPRVDAIGGSSAGVYVNNQPMIASLFQGVPAERFDQVRNLFLDIRDELGAPLEIVNDGEVAALAGSISLGENAVLGIALGSSEAAGYVTPEGSITGWLNELAFAPVDYSPKAAVDEWSGDRGCGAKYFSQQAVFRLAAPAGIDVPPDLSPARKLEFVQEKLEAGHPGATDIWRSMGIYLGYGLAHYADFYALKHVLLLGRCTSGRGGRLILEGARAVLGADFPALAERLNVHLPDEKSRRVGQAIAAAGLPALRQPEEIV